MPGEFARRCANCVFATDINGHTIECGAAYDPSPSGPIWAQRKLDVVALVMGGGTIPTNGWNAHGMLGSDGANCPMFDFKPHMK